MLFILLIFIGLCVLCGLFEKIVTPSTQSPSNDFSPFMHKCNEIANAKKLEDLEIKPQMSEEEFKVKKEKLMELLNRD